MRYLSLSTVQAYVAEARRRGVSQVARSPRGFVAQYARAGGDPRRLSPYWRARRDAFVARHMAQAIRHHEALITKDGKLSRRHLALIMWAYSPTPRRL